MDAIYKNLGPILDDARSAELAASLQQQIRALKVSAEATRTT